MSSPPSLPAESASPGPTSDRLRWFVEHLQPHEASLRAYLHGSFPAVRDVDDVVQESFLRVWRARAAQPIVSARGFLFRVARHLAIDRLREDRRSPIEAVGDLADLPVSEDQPTVSDAVSRNEKIQLLVAAIDRLPAKCREVVVLRKLHLLPQREVAERLGISEKGVEIQLSRGLARCRDYLRARGVDRLFCDEG